MSPADNAALVTRCSSFRFLQSRVSHDVCCLKWKVALEDVAAHGPLDLLPDTEQGSCAPIDDQQIVNAQAWLAKRLDTSKVFDSLTVLALFR